MNALELADWLENHVCGAETTKEVIVMLRQQQAEIEALKANPVKELTEDMLWELAERHLDTDDTWGESNVTGIGDFIEAILRKVQEK